jgi:CBS domain-containing protein
MSLRDLATCPAVTCAASTSVQDAAKQMASAGVGLLIVAAEERPVGVLTDRDIVLRAVATGHGGETPVSDVMTSHVHTVVENASVEHAATVMADKQCRRLAVTDPGGRVVGVLSIDDVLHVAGGELREVARALRGARYGHPATP